jgi:hypothetical protein
MNLSDFHNYHKGETALLVMVGPNLKLTPPEMFDYPSFSVNSILKYEGWKPTYYVGVDHRLKVENGAEICRKYADIPKFVPTPDWDDLQGENFYRFKHREGGELLIGGQLPNHPDALTRRGINYRRVPDAVFQIAWHMGFTTMLCIGMQHNPADELGHFWGHDGGASPNQPVDWWFEGYRTFSRAMGSTARVLNISEDTYVPADVLPRDDWRKWASRQTTTPAPIYAEGTMA